MMHGFAWGDVPDMGTKVGVYTDAGREHGDKPARRLADETDLFTGLGCRLAEQRIVVVKSWQHFRAAFAPLATRIIVAGAPGSVTPDLEALEYRRIRRPKWPL